MQGSATVAAELLGYSSPDDVITPPLTFARLATPRQPYIQLEFSHHLQFEGTLDSCNAALNSLVYRGDQNWNSLNKGKDVLTFTVQEVFTAGGGVPTNDTRSMFVEVISVNDAPVLHAIGPY